MRTRVLVAGAAILLAAGITACERTTPGTVAMTTEPGASTTRSSTPSTSQPRTSSPRTSSNVPPPSDSLTMTCKAYLDLDPDTQTAVVDEILKQEGSVLGPQNTEIAKTLADAVCQFLPTSTVSEILLGGSPP
jgi:hypothetical protein